MKEQLKDKVIFLTGGSAGIGWACAKAYVAEGARIALAARDRNQVETAADELGPNHLGIECDVSRKDNVKSALAATLKKFGRLDAVHNNAGIATPSKACTRPPMRNGTFCSLRILKGILYTTRYAFEALQDQQRLYSEHFESRWRDRPGNPRGLHRDQRGYELR